MGMGEEGGGGNGEVKLSLSLLIHSGSVLVQRYTEYINYCYTNRVRRNCLKDKLELNKFMVFRVSLIIFVCIQIC